MTLILNTNDGNASVSPEDILAIINPPIPQANTFTSGTAVYQADSGLWVPALNDLGLGFATFVVGTATPLEFTLARPGDIVETGLTGLTPGHALHTSPTIPGALVAVASQTGMPVGAYASNILGYAINGTQMKVREQIAYLTTFAEEITPPPTTTMDSSTNMSSTSTTMDAI